MLKEKKEKRKKQKDKLSWEIQNKNINSQFMGEIF
jgi:hypothetical protein